MTLHRMVELLEIEMECVRRNGCGECNRACHICDLLQDDTELHEMYAEVIARMKAQEPKLVHVIADINHRKIGECPTCGKLINSGDYPNYCGHCGQAVKWE